MPVEEPREPLTSSIGDERLLIVLEFVDGCDFDLDSLRHKMLDAGADFAFKTCSITFECELPPLEGGRSGVSHADGAGESALLVDRKIGDTLGAREVIGFAGGVGEVNACLIGLANPFDRGVLPGEMLVRAIA